jgi:AcrR family transcriptional regulator
VEKSESFFELFDQSVGRHWRQHARRREIVRRAAILFDEQGYHQTSMENIAEAVGIRKPSLYYYFKSKDELLFWIHEEFVDWLLERHDARLKLPLAPTQLVHEMIADILELMETHRGHVRVFFEHHRELAGKHKEKIKLKRDRYHAMVEDIVRRGVETGEFRTVDVRLTTLAIFGTVNWAYQWYRSDGRLRPREIAYVFSDLLLNGMSRIPATPPQAELAKSESAARSIRG